jgi:hypothetical protein
MKVFTNGIVVILIVITMSYNWRANAQVSQSSACPLIIPDVIALIRNTLSLEHFHTLSD